MKNCTFQSKPDNSTANERDFFEKLDKAVPEL